MKKSGVSKSSKNNKGKNKAQGYSTSSAPASGKVSKLASCSHLQKGNKIFKNMRKREKKKEGPRRFMGGKSTLKTQCQCILVR
jgi:hypothetical protein